MAEKLVLPPIEEPRGLLLRCAYWYSRRRFGKVLTPLKVIYARKPGLLHVARHITKCEDRLTLDPAIQYLVKVQVSRLNGCAFCEDIGLASAVQRRIGKERFADLDHYATSPAFAPAERAALTFAEEATRNRRVTDATWTELRQHFNETQIVELTWLNAAENYYNLHAAVLGIGSDELAKPEPHS